MVLSEGGYKKNLWMCRLLRMLLLLGFHDHVILSPEFQGVYLSTPHAHLKLLWETLLCPQTGAMSPL